MKSTNKIKPDRDLVEIFLIIIAIMFVLVLSMTYTAYGLTSYNIGLSDSCITTECFDICELSIFDNSTKDFSGPINYSDNCSRSAPATIPFSVLFDMYGYESIIEINGLNQNNKDQKTITIYPDLNILRNSPSWPGEVIRFYNQTSIDRNCDLVKVTNDFSIIANTLQYVLSQCQDRQYLSSMGNYNVTIKTHESKDPNRYPNSSNAFLNNCLAGQDPRFLIINCYSEFLKHQDQD